MIGFLRRGNNLEICELTARYSILYLATPCSFCPSWTADGTFHCFTYLSSVAFPFGITLLSLYEVKKRGCPLFDSPASMNMESSLKLSAVASLLIKKGSQRAPRMLFLWMVFWFNTSMNAILEISQWGNSEYSFGMGSTVPPKIPSMCRQITPLG